MNRQKVFNMIAEHLIKQGVRSRVDGFCSYRNPDGLKCAVGAIIKDEFYTPQLEKEPLSYGSNRMMSALTNSLDSRPTSGDIFFLSRLQQIHDHVNPLEWKTHLGKFAVENALTTPTCLVV